MKKQDYVYVNGKRYNLHKNLQDFVCFTMKNLLETNSIPKNELERLFDIEYCKETFNLKFPLLSKDRFACTSDKNHPRYYADTIAQRYYLCNDWYPARNEEKFSEWLESLAQ